MEMEPNIENITLDEYREYATENERRLQDNVRSKNSPTRYKGAEFNSSHHDKSVTLDFTHYYEDALLDGARESSEWDVNLEKEEAQVKDDEDGDTYDIWDIMVKDIKQIKQFFNVPNET
ncbi:hypothetical protein Tco_1024299 [Tanacetum coccineum]